MQGLYYETPVCQGNDPEFILRCLQRALRQDGPELVERKLPDAAASVALVVHMTREGPSLLWIRRATNPQDPWSGHMGFPGGRQDERDRSSRDTAERETAEEVGLTLAEHAQYLGALSERPVYNRTGMAPFKLVPHVYWVPELPPLEPDPSEVAEAASISFRHMLDPSQVTENRMTWRERNLRFPAIRYGSTILWGLSLQVWTDFCFRLEKTELFPLVSSEDGKPLLIGDPRAEG